MFKRKIMHVKMKAQLTASISKLKFTAYRSGNTFNESLCVVLEQNLWLT